MCSVDAAVASVVSVPGSIFHSKKSKDRYRRLFSMEKMFLLLTDFAESLIYQLAMLVKWFVDLIGCSQSVIDSDRQVVYPITCQVCF